MAVAAVQGTGTSVRDRVIGWIDEDVRSGMSPREAAERADRRLIAERRIRALHDECGPEMLADLWRRHNHAVRAALRSGAVPDDAGVSAPAEGRPFGRLIVPPEVMRTESALMESMWPVAGGWTRFGDLDSGLGRALSASYRKLAAANARVADGIDAVIGGLDDGQTVRERYSEEEVRKLMFGARP